MSGDPGIWLRPVLKCGETGLGPVSGNEQQHADSAIESPCQFRRRNAALGRQPTEDGRQLPACAIKGKCQPLAIDAGWVFDKPAACDMTDSGQPTAGMGCARGMVVDSRRGQQGVTKGWLYPLNPGIK